MTKKVPDWLRNVDFSVKPKTVIGSTGEVLIGGEVDELRTGDGLRPAIVGGRRKKRKKNKQHRVEADTPTQNLSRRANAKISRSIAQKANQKKAGHTTTVVPTLFGQPSSSYIVHDGALVAKGGRYWRRKIKNKHKKKSKTQPKSTYLGPASEISNQVPKNPTAAVQHLGKKDPIDASKRWAAAYRDNGKYGSFPIHDPHGDESGP